MTRITIRLAGSLIALSLAAASHASAQDAITLETIGAVRMASPDEVRRMTAPPAPAAAQPAPADAGMRHAAVTQ